jgi:hypothetical protein
LRPAPGKGAFKPSRSVQSLWWSCCGHPCKSTAPPWGLMPCLPTMCTCVSDCSTVTPLCPPLLRAHPPSRAIDTSIATAIVHVFCPPPVLPAACYHAAVSVGAVPTPDLQCVLANRWCCMKGKWAITLCCCYHLLSCVRLCWRAFVHWRPRCRCCLLSLCGTHVRPQHHHDARLPAVTVVCGGGRWCWRTKRGAVAPVGVGRDLPAYSPLNDFHRTPCTVTPHTHYHCGVASVQ